MKKSTLITTIAMIVVVVVALSTATYAWFSSSTATTVSGTMSTTAISGWILYGGSGTTNPGTGADAITYTSSVPELHFLNSLYSPVGALSGSLTSDGLSASYTQTKFYKAEQQGIGMQTTATAETPAFVHQESPTSGDIDNLNYIRIINNNTKGSATSDNLQLTIYVYIDDAKPTALIAGKRFCTYIATDSAANAHYNTRYYHGSVDSDTATRIALVEASGVTYSTAGNPAKDVTVTSALATDGYTIVTADAGFALPDATVISKGGAYYTITIDLGAVTRSNSLNIVFYAWFDGWALDNTASGGAVNVLYSFATAGAGQGSSEEQEP